MSDTPKVIIPGNLKGSVPENIVTDALYILDSSRAKNQKVINDEFEQRIDDIQELAEISIEGGTIQIANAADFNNPTQEQRAKVPTVGAVIDGYTANILPNTGNPSTPIYIDNFHRPQVVTSILLPGNISSQNGNIEALNGGVAAFGIGTLSLGGGGGGGDVSSILFNPAVPYVEGEGYIAVEGILSLPAYPGSASVQSWGFAKGIKIGATSTPYFSEAGIITIPAYPNISGKADKVVNATEGNFASLDALGNLQDAGVNALSFATAAQGAKADAAEIALAQIMTPKGNHSLPVYINTSGIPTVIDSLSVTGNIQSTQGGVSAFGIGSLALGGGGGQGTLTEIQIDGTTIPDVEGIVDLPAYPTWATLSGRPTLSAVATSGRFIDLTDTPTTLAGYGILDAKINNGVITLGLDTITPITSHQTIYTLTIQRNGVTVDSFNAASANKTINIEDVASLSAFNTLVGHLTSKGSHSRPIYLNGTPEGVEIDSLNVPGNIESTQGGVSAFGISNLAVSGGSGTGTLTQIQINGTPVTDTDGIVNITATTGSSAGKIAVAGQQIAVNGLGSAAYASTSDFASANHTQPFLTLTNLPTTLSGYGITDAASSSDLSSLSGRVNEIEGYFDGGIANSAARLSNNAKTGDTNNPVYFTANGVPAAISYTIGRNVAANEDVTAYQGGDSINITNHVVKVQMAGTSSPSASGNDISFIDTISQSTAGVLTATKKTVRSATQSQSGVVTTGEQIFAGAKTFNSTLTAIDDITSTTGDIMALAGGVSAFGIASLSSSGGSGSGTLTQIQVNGIALGDTEGIVNITATSGSSNGQIKIAGQDINVTGLGQAAYCGVGQVYSGNSGLVTGGQVYSAISALPTPMQFKGSLGVGGTYTASTLPPAAASNNGWDLKVITDGTYQGVVAKVGDQLISDGTNWILIPSGDEPSGTVTSVGMTVPTGLSVSGSPITSSGTLAISFASGYSIPTTSKQSNWDTAYTNSHTHSNITLSTTAQAYDGSHTIALPSSDPYTSARIPSSHTHGNIQNGGTLQTNDITVANGDKLVVTDASDSAKVARTSISFDASTTNKALTPKGTWESFLQTHQSIYTLTIQKNGTTIDTFDPKASPNKTINISDVASASTLSSHVGNTNNPHSVQLVVGTGNDAYKIKTTNGTFITVPYATIAGKVGTSTVGSTSLPVYINSGVPAIITSLSVPGNIQSTAGGVSANGIVSLALNGGGGGGTLTQIQINGVPLSEESGIVNIAADQTYNASTNKIATQATVTNAINALDYTAIGLGTGKTLASLTEVNGVIGATFQDISIAISQVSGLQSALDNKLSTSLKGAANGLAELDSNGFVPSSQLPSYVDDVLEYPSLSDFPSTGTAGKIYVALDTNLTYRWSGTTYVEISPSLALGETSSTAYRGDRGATAYAHATDASRLTTAKSSGFYKFATTAEGHIASVTAVTASDLTSLIGSTTYAPYNSAGYLPLSGGTMSNTNLVTNLNADLLDGREATGFVKKEELPRSGQSYNANSLTNAGTYYTTTGDRSSVQAWENFPDNETSGPFDLVCLRGENSSYPVQFFHNYDKNDFWLRFKSYFNGGVNWKDWAKIWTSANHGSGSGLDADLLDGEHASAFLHLTGGTLTGATNFNNNCWVLNGNEHNDIINKHWANYTLYDNTNTAPLTPNSSIRNAIRFGWYDTYWNIGNIRGASSDSIGFGIALEDTTNNRLIDCFRVTDDDAYVCGNTVIHSGNIGSQSVSYATSAGDADTLDGYHASYFAEATHTHSTLQSNFTNTGASNIPFYGSRFEYGILTGDGNPSSDLIALDPYAQVEYLNLPWYTGNYGGQLMFGANSGKIGYRTIHNGTWTSIKEIITRGNLVSETTNWNTITSNPTVFISSEANASNAPITGAYIYGIKMRFHREDNTYQADLVTDLYHDRLFFRRYYDGYIGSWKELAFLDSNVASATYATSAGNADTVDNLHATDFVRNYGTDMPSDSAAMIGYGKTPDGWNTYGPAMTFGISSYFINIQNEYNQDILYYRRYTNGSYGNWKTIAFTDSNVASATQLQTSRKLWGNYFNGTADVTGYMQFSNGDLIHAKDNGGTDRYVLGLTDSVSLGYGTAAGGIATGIYGNSIGLYYGTSHTAGLTLDSTGNVGIGTTQPSEKLHVAGNILANGNIVANGGVAARGMATLQGGAGTGNPVTQINVGSTAYTPSNGVVSLPAYPTWSTLSGKPSNVSAFTNDSGYIDSSALAVTFTTTTLTSSSTSLYLNNTVQRSTLQKVTISSANAYQTFTLNLTGNGSYYGYHRQVLVMNNSGQSINLSLAGANYIYIGTYEILTNGGWQHNDSNPIPMDSNNQMFLLDIIQASSSEYPVVKVTRMNFWAD